MSNDHAVASLWRTRITWAALGAGLSALLLWNRGAPPQRDPAGEESMARPPMDLGPARGLPRHDSPGSETPRERVNDDTSHDTGHSDLGAGSSGGTAGGSSSGTAGGSSGLGTSSLGDPTGAGEEALPVIPLPRMPGSRFMRQTRRPDEQAGATLITLGLSVPAPGSQVEGFYRRALKDAKMKVFGGRRASAMGRGYDSTLKGRGTHASAEVTIHQRAGRLRSVVRIYWRAKD